MSYVVQSDGHLDETHWAVFIPGGGNVFESPREMEARTAARNLSGRQAGRFTVIAGAKVVTEYGRVFAYENGGLLPAGVDA